MVGREPGQPVELLGAPQVRVGLPGEGQEVRRVRAVRDAGLRAEEADRLQHPVPPVDHVHEGPVDQVGQHVLVGVAHRHHRVERGATGEHGEAPGQLPLVGPQQVPAPLDGRAQGAVARGGRAVAAVQQREMVVCGQSRGDLLDGELAQPRGRELDRQRQPVQRGADLGDGGAVGRTDDETGADGGRAVGEQPYRRVVRPQWSQRQQRLAGQPERLPAGREHRDAGTFGQQGADQRRDGVDDVLAVVQHQQQLAVERGDQATDRVGGGAERRLPHAERAEDRRRHLVGNGGQVHHAHLAAAQRSAGGDRLEREAGLADAAGAEDGDQPGVAVGGEPFQLPRPADEAGQGGRRAPGGLLGAQDREVGGRQLRRRVGAELLGEQAPGVLVRDQGLGRAARGGERPHELAAQPFPQRVPRDEALEVGDARAARVGVDQVLDRGQPQLVEAGHLVAAVGEVRQRRAAPQRERLPQRGGGVRGPPRGEQRAARPP